jgi:polyketide cyclase/dehydrase/lipid transport protein
VARYHATVQSQRPPAETFDYLATFSNAADWDPGVLADEQLDPGPVTVGTRFRLVVPFLGLRMPLTYHVTSYQPGHEVVLAATSGPLHATDKIVVTGAARTAPRSATTPTSGCGDHCTCSTPSWGRAFAP